MSINLAVNNRDILSNGVDGIHGFQEGVPLQGIVEGQTLRQVMHKVLVPSRSEFMDSHKAKDLSAT
jgi:hypothetical protein